MPNIWSLNNEEKSEEVDSAKTAHEHHEPVVSHDEEDELEKPSFLRRLARRRNKDVDSEDIEK
jgi:hypothetical protein